MRQKSTKLLQGIGWLYLGGSLLVFFLRWNEVRALELNELGDLLAGIFSPLAFLWLVLGYLQQGRELEQNTEALRLQAHELKLSVEQQTELARVAREQLEVERRQYDERIRPRFDVKGFHVTSTYGSQVPSISVNLVNYGAKAVDVTASIEIDDYVERYSHESIEQLGAWSLPIKIYQIQFENGCVGSLKLSYHSVQGKTENEQFWFKVYRDQLGKIAIEETPVQT